MTTIEQYIVDLYKDEKLSIQAIVDKLGSGYYPMKVYRVLAKCGVTLRDTSEAQKVALEKGRASHPLKPKKNPKEF